jgi:hypothetical protein
LLRFGFEPLYGFFGYFLVEVSFGVLLIGEIFHGFGPTVALHHEMV